MSAETAVMPTTMSDSPLPFKQIKRLTLSLAGQTIAIRVSGDPVSGNNGLFYYLTDHLGSTSALMTSSNGIRSGSMTRYHPFGSYRGSAPAQQLTDQGFTGHKHNDDLGLIYMNARYYVGSIGRFASADTIVPDPMNPQQYNRYTYVLNNPLKFIDSSGHCAHYASQDGDFEQFMDCFNAWTALDQYYGRVTGYHNYPNEYMSWLLNTATTEDIISHLTGFGVDYQLPKRYGDIESNFILDFMSLTGSVGPGVGPTVSIMADRYGAVYITVGGQLGMPGVSGSLTGGSVTQGDIILGFERPDLDQEALKDLLTGWSFNVGGGYAVGGSLSQPLSREQNNLSVVQAGIYYPQADVSLSYTGVLYPGRNQASFWNSRPDYWWHHIR
jgi:RHS repeat-associated protein